MATVQSPSSERILRSDEGLTLETSAFRISVRWPIYIINSVDKIKFLYTTSPPTQHHSFFRNYPFIHFQTELSLNVAKTEFMVIGSNQRLNSFSDNQVNVEIDTKLITKVKEAKSLGVIIDEHLSWSNYIGDLSKKISSAIGALKRIRPCISKRTALQIYQALILPHFDYCSSVWGDCNLTLSDKLQQLQKRAARAITRSNYDTSATFLLNLLNLLADKSLKLY